MRDLTREWLKEKGFEELTRFGETCYFKEGICIDGDFDGWVLCPRERLENDYTNDQVLANPDLASIETFYLGTKPHWKFQVKLLYEALTGEQL